MNYPEEYKELARNVIDNIFDTLGKDKLTYQLNYYYLFDSILLAALNVIKTQQDKTPRRISTDEILEMNSKYMSYIMADLNQRNLAFLTTDEDLK